VCVIKYIGWTFAWLAAFVCATWATGALYFDFPATGGFAAILFVLVSHKPFTKRRLSLHKCWPPHSHSDISPQHEQKHLLHNRSNCRYRNRAQIARPLLGGGPAAAIATGEKSSLLTPIATFSVSLSAPTKS
jgi:hypothetical protein